VADTAINIRLVGSDEDASLVQFGDFNAFCGKLTKCLRRSEAVVTHEAGRLRFRIAGLHSSSAAMKLEPIRPKKGPDRRVEIVRLFKETVSHLQAGVPVDPRWTGEDLKEFRGLFTSLKNTKEVWIEGVQVTAQYLANVDNILGSSISSKGSVSGFLEALNVHTSNRFVLYPPILDSRVICYFPESMFEQVRAAIKRNVTVTGLLFYQPDRPFPEKVQVEALEVHPPDSELPTLDQLRGVFGGCTGGKSAVEFVRGIRDKQ
jgi:hypothetical protein